MSFLFFSGVSRISQTRQKPVIWQFFCQKLHEDVKKNWTEECVPWDPPLDPPMRGVILTEFCRQRWSLFHQEDLQISKIFSFERQQDVA